MMPRDRAVTHVDIWGDDDYLDLTPAAQHLHYVLSTSPTLSFCGSGDWAPGRIAARAKDWSADDVIEAGIELSAGLFLLVDSTTDEFLLRSWIKHDGLYRIQNMAVSMANARAALASRDLRGVVVHEVLKLRAAEADLKSWERDQVVKMLDQKAIDPSTLEPFSPWVSPRARGWVSPKVSPSDEGQPSPSVSPRATPSPSPTPYSSSSKESAPRKRAARLEAGWMPDRDVIDAMKLECPGVAFEAEHRKFVDYWIAKSGKDATKVDWNATWRNWMRRAGEHAPSRPGPSGQKLTKREQTFLDAEMLKDNPNPAVLAQYGIDRPELKSIQGGIA
jgi:hypothetical protein